ncbi:MAG: hypothetical protein IH586_24090, partial [Anaerolineaceae bacterium]|nr:hypothetical protein [Anaerolineaceae bacterium]
HQRRNADQPGVPLEQVPGQVQHFELEREAGRAALEERGHEAPGRVGREVGRGVEGARFEEEVDPVARKGQAVDDKTARRGPAQAVAAVIIQLHLGGVPLGDLQVDEMLAGLGPGAGDHRQADQVLVAGALGRPGQVEGRRRAAAHRAGQGQPIHIEVG